MEEKAQHFDLVFAVYEIYTHIVIAPALSYPLTAFKQAIVLCLVLKAGLG